MCWRLHLGWSPADRESSSNGFGLNLKLPIARRPEGLLARCKKSMAPRQLNLTERTGECIGGP